MFLVAGKNRLDELEHLSDLVRVLGCHPQAGLFAETHIDGQRGRKVDLDLVDERFGTGDEIGRRIAGAGHRADHAVGAEEDDRVGHDFVLLRVDRHNGRTTGHDDRREAVDQGGIVAQRIAVDVERSDHQIVRQVINVPHLLLDAGDRNFLQGYLVRHHASLLIRFLK